MRLLEYSGTVGNSNTKSVDTHATTTGPAGDQIFVTRGPRAFTAKFVACVARLIGVANGVTNVVQMCGNTKSRCLNRAPVFSFQPD